MVCVVLLGLSGGAALLAGDPPPAGASAAGAASRPTTQAVEVRQNMLELWRASIGALSPQPAGSPLEAVIRQLRALQLAPKETPAPASPAAATQPAPARVRIRVEPGQEPTSPPEGRQLDPSVLEKLKQLPAQGVASPEELAEALFLTGHLDAAFVFYEQALGRAEDDQAKGWLIYQMGNCRRPADPATARTLYARVVAEHADSVWASLADTQAGLIEWHQLNSPRRLLRELAATTTQPAKPVAKPPTSQPAAPTGGKGS